MTHDDRATVPWAGGLERLGKDGIARIIALAESEGVGAAMSEGLSREPDLIPFFRITGRADWRFYLPEHGHACAVVLGSGLGGTAFDLSEDYGDVVSCERSREALAWQNRVMSGGSFPNVRIVEAQPERVPLPDGCADLVALDRGFTEAQAERGGEDPAAVVGAAVRDARRLLRDGGWLYWGVENRPIWPFPRHVGRAGARTLLTPNEARKLLAREGMTDVAFYWVRPDLETQLSSGWLRDSRTFVEFVRRRRARGLREAIQSLVLNVLGRTHAFRWFVPHVVVLARRGAADRPQIAPHGDAPAQPAFVRDAERLLTDAGRPVKALEAMLVRANYNARGRLTYCLFERGSARPTYIVKLARTRRARDVVAAEARAFESLLTRSPFLRSRRPRVYHLGEHRAFVLEEFLVGRSLSVLQGRPEYEARALDWLDRFQSVDGARSLGKTDLMARLRRLAAATGFDAFRDLAEDTARRVETMADFDVAEVPVHGDFTPENILLDGDELYVVDWEWLRLDGWPLEDLWWILIVSARGPFGAPFHTGVERVLDVLTGRGAHARRCRNVARDFASARRVPSMLVPVFAIVTLLEMTLRWKDERRIDWQKAPAAEYEAALRGLLVRQDEFWTFWGDGDDTHD